MYVNVYSEGHYSMKTQRGLGTITEFRSCESFSQLQRVSLNTQDYYHYSPPSSL